MTPENYGVALLLGQLLTPIVVGVMGWLLRNAVSGFERRISSLESDVRSLNEVMVDQRALHERINSVRVDLSGLSASHNSFVTERRAALDLLTRDLYTNNSRITVLEKLAATHS